MNAWVFTVTDKELLMFLIREHPYLAFFLVFFFLLAGFILLLDRRVWLRRWIAWLLSRLGLVRSKKNEQLAHWLPYQYDWHNLNEALRKGHESPDEQKPPPPSLPTLLKKKGGT